MLEDISFEVHRDGQRPRWARPPARVINNGEATVPAAFAKIDSGNVLGISMSSSEVLDMRMAMAT